MAGIRDHKDLDVYKLSDGFRRVVRRLTRKAVFRSHQRLASQLTEAAESPCPNLAEGFSRYYPRENARFVSIAKGSLSEALEHLERAHDLGLVDNAEYLEAATFARRARGAAAKYIRYLNSANPPNEPHPRR
jgi:four helix bundle protein